MRIVGGLDIHRRQITFDYRDERSGQIHRGRIAPADRMLLRRWLATTLEGAPAAFAVEACTGWRVGGGGAEGGGGGGDRGGARGARGRARAEAAGQDRPHRRPPAA